MLTKPNCAIRRWTSTLLLAFLLLSSLLALAATPASLGALPPGPSLQANWSPSGGTVVQDQILRIDGNVYITGSVTLRDSTLILTPDNTHRWKVIINSTGTLNLENSILTVETSAISPYLKISTEINGTLALTMGSLLKFPGYINTYNAGRLNVTGSSVTGFTAGEVTSQWSSLDPDDNDDGPTMQFRSTSEVNLLRSRIERLYEGPVGGGRRDITVQGSATVWIVDSFVAVDFFNNTVQHNTIIADGTSRVNIYNMTVDPEGSATDKLPALVPLTSGRLNVYRWANITTVDTNGQPLQGARVRNYQEPGGPQATYPDNGGLTYPHAYIRWVLGKTSTNFDLTGDEGTTQIPLLSDYLDTGVNGVNGAYSGNYRSNVTYTVGPTTYYGQQYYSLPAYPDLAQTSNVQRLVITVAIQGAPITWSSSVTINYPVTISRDLIVTGKVTLRDSNLTLAAPGDSTIRIQGSGALVLINTTVQADHKLTIRVEGGWFNASKGSILRLTGDTGVGLLLSSGSGAVDIRDSTVLGDVDLQGRSANLRGVTFTGDRVYIDTTNRAYMWDPIFTHDLNLTLATDDGNINTVDVDLRNITFSPAMEAQVVFRGNQWANITNISNFEGTNWWIGHLLGNAKVSRHVWLTINSTDGTQSLLPGANVTIRRTDSTGLVFSTVPTPGDAQLFGASNNGMPANTITGWLLYRALVEEINGGVQYKNNTYQLDASKVVDGTTYYFDNHPMNFTLNTNEEKKLVFSSLTPDFSIAWISFSKGAGNVSLQPRGLAIDITAMVRNSGSVDKTNVQVTFYRADIDLDNNGVMDASPSSYSSSKIYDTNISNFPRNSLVPVTLTNYRISKAQVDLVRISVVVNQDDGDGVIPEIVPGLSNLKKRDIEPFAAPDLAAQSISLGGRVPVEGAFMVVNATVYNDGMGAASGANVSLYRSSGPSWIWQSSYSVASLGSGGRVTVPLQWTPPPAGTYNLAVVIRSGNETPANTDYYWANNTAYLNGVAVLVRPDLSLLASDFPAQTYVKGKATTMDVTIRHTSSSASQTFTVTVYLGTISPTTIVGSRNGVAVSGDGSSVVRVDMSAIQTTGSFTLKVFVDSGDLVAETNEGNNQVDVALTVVPPTGAITLDRPSAGANFAAGDSVLVEGYVRTLAGVPIPDVDVTILLRDPANQPVLTQRVRTDSTGHFIITVNIPDTAQDGQWTIRATTPGVVEIQDAVVPLSVVRDLQWYQRQIPILNLPLWMLLVVLALVGAVGIGINMYMKYIGVGRTVECGECGAFIPESSSACPKCGVEFERSMAKCSNCHAWIPGNVKNCPECGIEFASGEIQMTDYQERMRGQYDQLVTRYRMEASRALGRQLSDKEFQDWWRRQPSFVTFDDWVRQEEEMKKMGSRPCPRCGQPNSVTATVCHKCGSPMQEAPPTPPRIPPQATMQGPPRPPQAPPPPPPSGPSAPGGAGGAGGGIFRRLGSALPVKKPQPKPEEKKDKDDIL